MRIVVTGREGQVVSSLVERARDLSRRRGRRPRPAGARPGATGNGARARLRAARPDLVVSAAAYTAVDQAEDEPELAFAVNAVGAGCGRRSGGTDRRAGHPSVDGLCVRREQARAPIRRTIRPAPRGVYGASKLAGEVAVAAANPRHLILRTAWVYSPFGKNFVKTMLRLAARPRRGVGRRRPMGQSRHRRSILPTRFCMRRPMLHGNKDFDAFGIYHLAGTGETNWSGFARHILDTSQAVWRTLCDG